MANGIKHPALSGAAMQFLAREFGGLIAARSRVLSVEAAVIEATGGDAERVALTFMNLGPTSLYVNIVENVSPLNGLRLSPSGGGISFNLRDDLVLPSYRWSVIGDAAGGTLLVIEVVRESVLIGEAN